jgi:hypothetical protein
VSIITVSSTDTRAIVAVDTLTGFPNGAVCESSKLQAIPHLCTVVAARGTGDIIANVMPRLAYAKSFDDAVDTLERELPRVLAGVRQREAELPTATKPEHSVHGPQELVIAGWSACAQRMVALRFFKYLGQEFGPLEEIRGLYSAPLTEEFQREFKATWTPETDEDLMLLARSQVACGRSVAPVPPIWGGRLLVAELERERVIIRSVCEL